MNGTGREQHGHAAGVANNSPVGCCLVRGFQRPGMSTKKAPPAGAPFVLPQLGDTGQEQCKSEPFVKNKGRVSSWRWYPAFCAIWRILGQSLRTQEKGQALTYRGVLSLAGVIYSAQQIGIYLEVLDNEIKEHFNCC